jgi:hypothetical protein
MSEQNVGAFFGVAEGDSAADAAVSTGDDCNAPLKAAMAGVGVLAVVGGGFEGCGSCREGLAAGQGMAVSGNRSRGSARVARWGSGADFGNLGIRGSLLVCVV